MARKRSSYRLGRRLKASRRDRLAYITYINQDGQPGDGKVPEGTPVVRRLKARIALGGEADAGLAIRQRVKATNELGGAFRANIFPPVTVRPNFALGGAMSAKVRGIPKQVKAKFDMGGAMSTKVRDRVKLGAVMGLGGTVGARIRSIPTTDPAATAIIAAMTSAPDTARQQLITRTVVGLKHVGVWSKLRALFLLSAHDSQAGLINWKTPATVAVPTGSPTFAADRGFKRGAGDVYIDTLTVLGDINASIFAKTDVGLTTQATQQALIGVSEPAGAYSGIGRLTSGSLPATTLVRIAANAQSVAGDPLGELITHVHDNTVRTTYYGATQASTEAYLTARVNASTRTVYLMSNRNATGGGPIQPVVDTVPYLEVAGWADVLTGAEVVNLNTIINNYLAAA